MNSVEAFSALLNGKKIQALMWKDNEYIYLEGNTLYNEEGHEDINVFYYFAEENSWQEYVEPKKDKPKQNTLKMYLLFLNDTVDAERHVVCARSKKEARKILYRDQVPLFIGIGTLKDYDNPSCKRWLSSKLSSCKTLCNVSGNFEFLIPNSIIV